MPVAARAHGSARAARSAARRSSRSAVACAAAIHLEGLDVDESRRLTRELLGGGDLPERAARPGGGGERGQPAVRRRARAHARGRRRARARRRRLDGDRRPRARSTYRSRSTRCSAARIDRLAPGERTVLEAASVVGKTFYRGRARRRSCRRGRRPPRRAPRGAAPQGAGRAGRHVLARRAASAGSTTSLIRDAAYRRLLKETRADLHEQAARWLEAKVGDLVEHDDVIGYQLEQAHQLPRRGRATRRAASSGTRQPTGWRQPVAARSRPTTAPRPPRCSGRALACLPADDGRARRAARRAVRGAAGDGRRRPRRPARWPSCAALAAGDAAARGVGRLLRGRAGQPPRPRHARPTRCAGRGGGRRGSPRARRRGRRGQGPRGARRRRWPGSAASPSARPSLDRALAAARRAGDRRRATAILAGAPVGRAVGAEPGDPGQRSLPRRRPGAAHHQPGAGGRGDLDAVPGGARGAARSRRRRPPDARPRPAVARGARSRARPARGRARGGHGRAARPATSTAAERTLRRAHEGFHALGIDVDAGLAAALLGRGAHRRGARRRGARADRRERAARRRRPQDRHRLARRPGRGAGPRGRARARRRRLAEEAVALAAPTDALLDHADALLSLAEVLPPRRRRGGRAAARPPGPRALRPQGGQRPEQDPARRCWRGGTPHGIRGRSPPRRGLRESPQEG